MNCWDFKRCGRERDGDNVDALGVCPAWPHHGTDCARVVGTLCHGRIHGAPDDKLRDCLTCDFYRSEHYARILVTED